MVEPITPLTPRPVRFAPVGQWWREVTFVHWAVAPEAVEKHLPAGTRPDTLDGVTFIGLVPFLMHPIGGRVGPRLPYIGTFCETNVRLYSVDAEGRRGVVFLSLDASRLVPVLGARISARLPYRWASMSLQRDGDVITYASRRILGRATSRVVVRAGPPKHATELDHFLTARWGLHFSWHGRTLYLPNDHPPWPLHQAELLEVDAGAVAAAGLGDPAGPPVSVLHSPGVPVRFGVPAAVGR